MDAKTYATNGLRVLGHLIKNNALILVALIAVILLLRECHHGRQIERMSDDAFTNQDSFRTVTDKLGRIVSLQKEVITWKSSALAKTIEQVEGLRNITSQIKLKTMFRVDTFKVEIEKPVYVTDSAGVHWLRTPALFGRSTDWYDLSGEIQDSGYIDIFDLSVYNEPVISVGYERRKFPQGLFKRQTLSVAYRDNNPDVKVLNMSNVTVEDKRTKGRLSVGAQAGYGVTRSGLGPYVGVGVGIRLIGF